MNMPLTVLFAPINAIGHLNPCVGIAEILKDNGHRIVFAINSTFNGKLVKYGFEEILINDENINEISKNQLISLDKSLLTYNGNDIGLYRKTFNDNMINMAHELDKRMTEIILMIKPDIIVSTNHFTLPYLTKSNIPWVLLQSCNPLSIFNDEITPPGGSGLPTKGDKDEWKAYRESVRDACYDMWKKFNNWLVDSEVCSLLEGEFKQYSPHLNIYTFPRELDYTDIRPLPSKWCCFDYIKITDSGELFEIPDKLKYNTGKLIYLSMGTLGSLDIKLMNRLVSILCQSSHRFIVSKGYYHKRYELADNMWGEKYLPQTSVLPLVDVVITHGGHNTITESFYFGKPMLVLPLFGDQLDNAQRIDETGYGIRLDPYTCTDQQLLYAIDVLVNNEVIKIKMEIASKRIQSPNTLINLPKLFENLVFK